LPLCGFAAKQFQLRLSFFFKQSLLPPFWWCFRQVLDLQTVIIVTVLTA
jgi:hypothetical protein